MDENLRHDFKNHLGIMLGFLELILEDTPATDPRHSDLLEVRQAAHACLALLARQPLVAPADATPQATDA
jgi:hypothetical protein